MMSRFPAGFIDEIKERLRPSDVIGRHVKLSRQGNEWAGLSPFTKEKTPSFFVNDHKGFYHCFSSGRHGDIIAFLQETQRMTFVEAVETLALEAGMELPRDRSQGHDAVSAKRAALCGACAAAEKFFIAALHGPPGDAARRYLRSRAVSREGMDRFSVGYAPSSGRALKDALIREGFDEKTLVDAGLLAVSGNSPESYDRFRNRIMFPITDTRGQVIAFGGRALDPGAKAKYLNSPETPVFSKGSVLYDFAKARREVAGKDRPPLVCEGYMDVIALHGHGITGAVAPLGTAMTQSQISLLWRIGDEPVLCFDGDRAGRGAAYRAAGRALPLLKPGKSLAFVFMPDGMDPDDFLRAYGADSFRTLLGERKPLVDVLWARESAACATGTPEGRAMLRRRLRELAAGIGDPDVRDAYDAELSSRFDRCFPPAGTYRDREGKTAENGRAGRAYAGGTRYGRYEVNTESAAVRPSVRLKMKAPPSSWRREAMLLLAAVNHPQILQRYESSFLDMELSDRGLRALLGEILSAFFAGPALDSATLKNHLEKSGSAATLKRVTGDPILSRERSLRMEAAPDEVERGFESALSLHHVHSGLDRDVTSSADGIFTGGMEKWKAACHARSDAVAASALAGDGRAPEDGSGQLEKALMRMKSTLDAKSGR